MGGRVRSPGKSPDAPLGLLRFKANAEAWRGKLERQFGVSPPTCADRERIIRWLNNLRGREAWLVARLEHTLATKRLLVEVLTGEKTAQASELRPPVEEAAPVEDGEDL